MPGEFDLTLIVNPAAGRGRAARHVPALVADLQAGGREISVQFTRSLAHAEELASDAVGSGRTPVAVGGDGLVNAVVNGVAEKADGVMGILPLGRGNDFARALGIRSELRGLELLERGDTRRVDLGHIGNRYFSCIASVGIDSKVMETVDKTRVFRGPLVYPFAAVRSLIDWKAHEFTVESDDDVRVFAGYSVAVANGPFFGAGMRLAPGASLEDGLFDVVTVGEVNKVDFARTGLKVRRGAHVHHEAVNVTRCKKVTISCDPSLMIYADGEAMGPGPLTAEVRSGALTVIS